MFQNPVEQMLGKSAWELFPTSTEPLFEEKFVQAKSTNLPVKFQDYFSRFGGLFDCRCYPTEDGISVFLVDITQTSKTLQRLRRSESELRRLAAVVEKCNDFVGICKPNGEPIYINRAGREMVGLEPDADLSETHFLKLFAEEDHAEMTETGIRALKKVGRWKGPVRFRNLVTGDYTPSHWNVFVISDPDSDLPEVWATVSPDLSEQQRMEDVLRASEQRARQASVSKSQFLANMSHEIRTPMAAILGYADLLLDHLEDVDDQNSVLVIKKNGEHLLDLINDILDLSRIEAGKFEVDIQVCNLPVLLSEIESLMDVRAKEKQLELRIRVEGAIPRSAKTDARRVRQVLINLLGNAIKFTERGYVELVVRYSADPQEPIVEFEVSDTGIGLTQEQQSRLFQPFTQADSSVARAYGGTGLGLAISKRLIEILQGSISLRSKLGKGTVFTVKIPVSEPQDVSVTELDRGQMAVEKPTSLKRRVLDCRVLVADDRRDIRFISQRLLEAAGATVITVDNGRRAIESVQDAIVQGKAFDLIILDMQMPIVDGYEAAAELRLAGITQPIIALTADAMKGDRERCLRAGCDDYIAKPIQQDVFIEMVGRCTQDLSMEQLSEKRQQYQALRTDIVGRQGKPEA